jgi:hypothetical protein
MSKLTGRTIEAQGQIKRAFRRNITPDGPMQQRETDIVLAIDHETGMVRFYAASESPVPSSDLAELALEDVNLTIDPAEQELTFDTLRKKKTSHPYVDTDAALRARGATGEQVEKPVHSFRGGKTPAEVAKTSRKFKPRVNPK